MSLDFITDSGYDVVTGQNTLTYTPQLGCSYFLLFPTLVRLQELGAPPGSDAALGVLEFSPYGGVTSAGDAALQSDGALVYFKECFDP